MNSYMKILFLWLGLVSACHSATLNNDKPQGRNLRFVNIPVLGIGYRCTGCPPHFCDDDPAIIYGYCCGCAAVFDFLPVRCPPVLDCPLNSYELCDKYEYMMHCCCAH